LSNFAVLSEAQGRELVVIARESLARYIRSGELYTPPDLSACLKETGGAFVTLLTRSTDSLRGCIGRLSSPQPLWQTVRDMAIAAGVSDNRFPPITTEEMKDCRIKVSVLSAFKTVSDPSQIMIGEHGVLVKASGRTGVFLPEVAAEMGWDAPTLLDRLCYEKCGLPSNSWKNAGAQISVFGSQVFSE